LNFVATEMNPLPPGDAVWKQKYSF